ncbi:MAG: alpha/beta hydrolase [Clostridia bacterium]
MKINVNNINLNFEKSGEGAPIVLLHGCMESLEIFDRLILRLSENYTVYALDSRCHGKSDNPKSISYDLMCDDVAEFVSKLKIEKPIIFGFSDGGIVALKLAIKYTQLASKIIICGANLSPSGLKKADLRNMKIAYFFTRSKFFKMLTSEPSISENELSQISISTIILAGEKDMIKEEHSQLIANSIRGSKFEIIKGETHGSYIVHSDKIYDILKKYL